MVIIRSWWSWWLSFWSCTSWSCTGESIIMQRRDVFVSLFVYLTRKRRDHIEYAWINMAVAWSTPYCCFYDTQVNIGTLVDCLWYHQHIALHCKKIILHQWTLLHPKRSCCVICERAYCCWRIYHTICKGKKSIFLDTGERYLARWSILVVDDMGGWGLIDVCTGACDAHTTLCQDMVMMMMLVMLMVMMMAMSLWWWWWRCHRDDDGGDEAEWKQFHATTNLQRMTKKLVLGPKKFISSVFKSSSTGNLKFSETSLNSRTVISNERFQNLSALLFT